MPAGVGWRPVAVRGASETQALNAREEHSGAVSPGPGHPQPRPVPPGVLLRYRVMAFTTAVLLIVLVFVGIPLQVAAGRPQVVNVVGTMHGFLYIVYLFAAYDLARRARFTVLQLAAMIGAGLVPFLAFVLERRVVRRVRELGGRGELGAPKLIPRVALRAGAPGEVDEHNGESGGPS